MTRPSRGAILQAGAFFALLILGVSATAPGQTFDQFGNVIFPTFFGPTPYLSKANSPFLLNIDAGKTYLETFECGTTVPGVTFSTGSVIGPGGLTDSVDGDDGAIDGSGTNGHSFFSGNGPGGIDFIFNATTLGGFPTEAGIVWTDGGGTTTFQAFDASGVSLGVIGPVSIADGSNFGTTGEDNFFGVRYALGISKIRISNSSGGIEADHLQYGVYSAASGADLSLTKGDAPDPVTTGAALTYTLTVSNAGPLAACNVTLTDTLPAGVTFVSASGTGWACAQSQGLVTCTLPSLAVGSSLVTIQVTAPASAGTITNNATVGSQTLDPVRTNDSASAQTTVGSVSCVAPADVTDLQVGPSTIAPGETFTVVWTPTMAFGVGQYEVLASYDGGKSFQAIAYTQGSSFSSTVFTPGAVIQLEVIAEPFCSNGTASFSGPSNVVTLTVTGGCPAPEAPSLSIDRTTVPQGETFTLSWTSTLPLGIGGPEGQYRILRSIGGAAFTSIGTTTTTSFTDTVPASQASNTQVSFRVIAERSCGTGGPGSVSGSSNAVTYIVTPGCVAPGAPGSVMLKSVQNPNALPTPTDFLFVSWSAPAGGTPVVRYGVRINGDVEAFTTGTSAILPPRGDRLDPMTAFVRAYGCDPEKGGGTAQSDPLALNLSPPAANFSVSPAPRVGVPVTFTDTSSPQATAWLWLFDDGGTDTRQSPTHTFTGAGPHQVFLIASNGAGSTSKGAIVTVAAAAAAGAAELEASAGRLPLAASRPLDASNPDRRRTTVRLSGEGTTWLRVKTSEPFETVLFLRFLDRTGTVSAERRLTLEGEGEGTYDLGAYGLTGEYVIELVGSQRYEATVSETRRPSPREIRR